MVSLQRSEMEVMPLVRIPSHRGRLEDIARLAGVGIATVDRVLNERGNVSEKTAEKVLHVARQLNLKRILPAAHHKVSRIHVILARPELPSIACLNRAFEKQAARIDKTVIIQRSILRSDEPKVVAKAIAETQANAIVTYTQDHPLIREAIEMAAARGVALVTVMSDLQQCHRLAYAGTDHFSAGRTAGYFMARAVRDAGPVIVLCHHFGFLGHRQRVNGLMAALGQHAPHLKVAEVLEGGDDSQVSEKLLLQSFRRHRHVAGVYNVGAANDACGSAIHSGILQSRPVFVGHELTDHTRALLMDGTMDLVIDQNLEHQAQFSIDVLMHHFGYSNADSPAPACRSDQSFRLFTPENLPAV